MEIEGVWLPNEDSLENAQFNLGLLRALFPELLVVTNDEVYRPGRASRHFRVVPPGVVVSGGVLPETLAKYAHIEVPADLAGCWSLDKGPEDRSLIIAVGRKDHDDFLVNFVRVVWPISYTFLLSKEEMKLEDVVQTISESQTATEFIRKALLSCDLIYCPREGSFAIFTRHPEVLELVPP